MIIFASGRHVEGVMAPRLASVNLGSNAAPSPPTQSIREGVDQGSIPANRPHYLL